MRLEENLNAYGYPLDGRSGKNWHVLWKVRKVMNDESATITIMGGKTIVVEFDAPLSFEDEEKLKELMTDKHLFDPVFPGFVNEVDSNVFVIQDAFMRIAFFNSWIESMGIENLDAMIFAVASDPVNHPTEYDRMEVHFSRLLTASERAKVEEGYARLGGWKA